MKLIIKPADQKDVASIYTMMREFATHQNLLEYLEITEEILHDILFGEDAFVRSLVARDDKTPIAYSFFYPYFSSFRGQRSVYLEDIFITEKYREFGTGEKILKEIARIGKEEFAAVRMDFQVLRSNESAIRFYKKHGAAIEDEERHVKIVDENFQNLTEK